MSRRLLRIVSWIVVCIVVGVGISTDPIGAQTPEPTTAVQAWIDAPLDGTVVTDTSPVVVTAHLAHPDGVRAARVRVRDADSAPVELGGGALETVQLTWQPPGEGVFPIAVAGRADGGWSSSATVLVVVDLDDEASGSTTTTTSTSSTVPTTTTLAGIPTTAPRPPSVTTSVPDRPVPAVTTTAPARPTTTAAATTNPAPSTSTTAPTTTAPTTTTTTTTSTTTTTTTTAPCTNDSPVVTGPASNPRLPVVSWTYSGCTPTGFRVVVSEDVGLTDVIVDATVGSADRTYGPVPVEPCREYFVRVSALFGPRVAPSHSAIHSFVTTGC